VLLLSGASTVAGRESHEHEASARSVAKGARSLQAAVEDEKKKSEAGGGTRCGETEDALGDG